MSLSNIEKIPVHQLTLITLAGPQKLQEIWEATVSDPILTTLAQTVYDGWPNTIQECDHKIQPYWCFRDEITYEEGILYKGIRIIMPQSTQATTLQELHQGHYAVNKMNLQAKEAVYWPGISEDIKATYHKCEICAKFTRTQQKETLQYVKTLQTTWEQLSMDIFTLKNTHYLLVVDYFSQFPVIQKLQSLHSTTIIKHLKEIFTEIGIP